MTVTKANKIIARTALEAFGGNPSVSKYWDENNVSNVDILSTIDRPYEGVTSHSTLVCQIIQLDTLLMKNLCE